MADDPRVEPVAEELARRCLKWLKRWPADLEDQAVTYWRAEATAALAVADEVQTAELERLRAEVADLEQQIHEDGGFIDRIVDLEQSESTLRADRDAAQARYTALVEGVRGLIDALDFVDVMIARPDPFMTFTPQSVQDRLRALLSTAEVG